VSRRSSGTGGPAARPRPLGHPGRDWPIVYISVATIIVIVQAGQFVGNWLARRALRR
jgi:D-methionine transport system permease protein